MIKTGDKKILIDALFTGFEGSYQLPQEVQEKLRLAQAPFDDVDLIIVTHAHGDHIDPDMVRQHLKNNPKAIESAMIFFPSFIFQSHQAPVGLS